MKLTYPNVEIIVCDNDSADNTKEIIESFFGVKYICEKQKGVSFARNALLDACSEDSEFIGFIDDDETVLPTWVESMLAGFTDETIATVGGGYYNIYECVLPEWMPESVYPRNYEPRKGIKTFKKFPGMPGGNGMCRLDVVRRKNVRFDTHIGRRGYKALSGEDNEFYQQVTEPEFRYAMVYHAWVYHYIPAYRLTFSYIQHLYFWDSVSEYCHRRKAEKCWLQNGYKLLLHTIECIASLFSFNRKKIVKSYLKIVRNVGYLYGPIFCWREKR